MTSDPKHGLCFLVAYQLNSLFIFMMLSLFNVQLRNKYDDDDDVSDSWVSCFCYNANDVTVNLYDDAEYMEPSANTQSTSTVRRTRAPDGGHIGHVTTRTSLSTSGRQFRRRSTSGDVIRFVTLRPRVIVKDGNHVSFFRCCVCRTRSELISSSSTLFAK